MEGVSVHQQTKRNQLNSTPFAKAYVEVNNMMKHIK